VAPTHDGSSVAKPCMRVTPMGSPQARPFLISCGPYITEALRLPGRILVWITGFVPLVLYATGIIRWLQKRRAAKQLKTRLEAKISRGFQDA